MIKRKTFSENNSKCLYCIKCGRQQGVCTCLTITSINLNNKSTLAIKTKPPKKPSKRAEEATLRIKQFQILYGTMQDIKKEHMRRAMKYFDGNISHVARGLNISLRNMRVKAKQIIPKASHENKWKSGMNG
jgi:DNA-binding NtrC family response regulator